MEGTSSWILKPPITTAVNVGRATVRQKLKSSRKVRE